MKHPIQPADITRHPAGNAQSRLDGSNQRIAFRLNASICCIDVTPLAIAVGAAVPDAGRDGLPSGASWLYVRCEFTISRDSKWVAAQAREKVVDFTSRLQNLLSGRLRQPPSLVLSVSGASALIANAGDIILWASAEEYARRLAQVSFVLAAFSDGSDHVRGYKIVWSTMIYLPD